jgi:hypothetical protein
MVKKPKDEAALRIMDERMLGRTVWGAYYFRAILFSQISARSLI